MTQMEATGGNEATTYRNRGRRLPNSDDVRLLLVDDDRDFVELTANYLEREHEQLTVSTETTVADALRRLADGGIDCIVSDYDMSPVDGLEFLEQVRETHEELPFVLLTGKGSEELASKAISRGVTDYLQKGYGIDHYTILANRIVNVVEQHRSRRALDESQKRLSLFFEQSPLGVIEWDEQFRLVRLNERASEILGYDEDELVGASWEALVPGTDDVEMSVSVETLLEHEGGYQHINRNVRKDGDERVCEWHDRVVTDERGDVVAVLSQFQDITDRVRRKEAIANLHDVATDLAHAETREEVFNRTVEAAESLLSFDTTAVAVENGGALELAAVSDERVRDELAAASRTDAVETAYRDGQVAVLEGSAVADGRDGLAGSMLVVPLSEHGLIQVYDEHTAAFDGTDQELVDLLGRHAKNALDRLASERTMERQTTELKERNEQLDRFVSVVSHDLRNPVQALKTSLELVENTGDSEDFDRCRRSIDRIETLLEDLLTLARQDGEIEPEPLELNTLARQAIESIETRSATIELEAEGLIEADHTRTLQLIENLVDNAIDHGGPDVTVRVGSIEDGFYIEDDGPGIPANKRQEVFEHGYSGDPGGTGFGLAIVEQVATDHGWEVTVTEGTDGGARFEIRNVDTRW